MATFPITPRKPFCVGVLDPVLMLCSPGLQGIQLTQRLGQVMELWVFRELFHVLEEPSLHLNSTYTNLYDPAPGYDQNAAPINLNRLHSGEANQSRPKPEQHNPGPSPPPIDRRSLKAWEQIHRANDPFGFQLYWLGDRVTQSRLPEKLNRGEPLDRRLQSYEILAQALEAQAFALAAETQSAGFEHPLLAACRDTAALAAALGSAVILAGQQHPDEPPYLVSCLEHWGIPCQRLSDTDVIVDIEQTLLRQMFVQAGLTQLLWAQNFQLAIVHLNVPSAFDPNLLPDATIDDPGDNTADFEHPWELENMPFLASDNHLWRDAQGYWYPLNPFSTVTLAHATQTSSVIH